MTAHQLAKVLLNGPDLEISILCDFGEDTSRDPWVRTEQERDRKATTNAFRICEKRGIDLKSKEADRIFSAVPLKDVIRI